METRSQSMPPLRADTLLYPPNGIPKRDIRPPPTGLRETSRARQARLEKRQQPTGGTSQRAGVLPGRKKGETLQKVRGTTPETPKCPKADRLGPCPTRYRHAKHCTQPNEKREGGDQLAASTKVSYRTWSTKYKYTNACSLNYPRLSPSGSRQSHIRNKKVLPEIETKAVSQGTVYGRARISREMHRTMHLTTTTR